MAAAQPITLRLTIVDPVPGVAYSLHDQKSRPVGAVVAAGGPLSLDVQVGVADGRMRGEFVRREGPERRFVYIAIGTAAGDHSSLWSRRAKIDIHTLSAELLAEALQGRVLEARLPGRAKDGGPTCATVHPISGWTLAG